ncbi:hypothetical protein BGW80DRAFT_507127 [Lactifluus volemus]|nr:hypothetical protein BGW80DRAFT_507127 [Lactifluus volemus]
MKIKIFSGRAEVVAQNELVVDDFLNADDPRTVAEDITDRFDFRFLFGDLNFRLDVSHLPAGLAHIPS